MTTTATKASTPFAFDANAERIRELNDKVLTAAKQTENTTVDTYEQAVNTLVDFSRKAADSTKVDWVAALAKSVASLITELTNTYTKAARELLK
jgi:3-methyladenine DNA glycosylase AlkD